MMTFRSCLLSLGFLSSVPQAEVITHYFPPKTEAETQWQQEIKESGINKVVIELAKAYFPMQEKVTVAYGDGDGPAYDSEKQTIYLPYHFYGEAKNYFAANHYEKRYGKTPTEGAIDTLLHTLLHELGHAYIFNQSIPVLGKEEDAVDDFASIMLIDHVDNGDEVAISAADMFAFESEDHSRPDYYAAYEYIDEHSFDLQRYFSTLCLVYGSNPKKHQHLLDEVEKEDLAERKAFCEERFTRVKENWQYFLQK